MSKKQPNIDIQNIAAIYQDDDKKFYFPLQDDDLEDFLSHYYYSVSILLLYTASVADKIVFELIENKDY